jgi:hypothetical protein
MVVMGGEPVNRRGKDRMRAPVFLLAALGLAACSPQVPDSGAGVGFNDYNSYNAPAPIAPLPVAPASGFSPDAAAAAIAKAEGGSLTPAAVAPQPVLVPQVQPQALPATRPRGNAPAGIQETTSEMTGSEPVAVVGGVSDEQDFEAVKARETIASDKARIENNRAQYQVDQPTALPQRSGDEGPSIVEFAISTTHPVGTQMYNRSSLRLTNSGTACAKFSSPDLAQEAFLAAGGPNKDRKGVDPDGDGYACAWDPAPFRTALN